MDIEAQMDALADRLAKSAGISDLGKDLVKATVANLGAKGLRKALETLSPADAAALKEVLEDMVKSHKELIARDKKVTSEPVSNSTEAGDYIFNEDERPKFDEADEKIATKVEKQDEVRHQGGAGTEPAITGQVIKAESMEEGKDMDADKKFKKLKKSIKMAKAALKMEKIACRKPGKDAEGKDIMVKGDSDRKQSLKMHLKDLKGQRKAMEKAMGCEDGDMEKGGSGSGRKPLAPGMEGLESVKNLRDRSNEASKMAGKFPGKKLKKNKLKEVMKSMQAAGLPKDECVAKLSKALEVEADKISNVWDLLAKGDTLSEKGNPEGSQVAPPAQMKDGKEVKKREPLSGKASETADEATAQVPALKKSDDLFQVDEVMYFEKSTANPFAHRTIGQNAHYSVDEYIALEHASSEARLKKSKFDYQHGEPLAKGDMPAEAEAKEQVAANAKANAAVAKEQKEAERNAVVDEKLTRLEAVARPGAQMVKGAKAQIKKSILNDLVERKLDFGDDAAEVGQANMNREAQGAFIVKSFADAEMDALFQDTDFIGKPKK